MKVENFYSVLDELASSKNVSRDVIVEALTKSLRKAYIQYVEAEDDTQVRAEITENSLDLFVVKEVIEPVCVEDLEISVADAKKYKKNAKIGDQIEIAVDIDTLKSIFALSVKSLFHQNLAEVDKQVLFDTYKDKIGEMVTGEVEACDAHGCVVRLANSTVRLSRRELIGDEMFQPGQSIRVYVANVSQNEKGNMLKVTRSDEGFLKRLFEEECTEVRDGTVIIKAISREAGIRSKLAVYSNDLNVDCVGSLIGINGTVIKRVVDQLGNKVKDKEKIDIIPYTENDGLYIVRALSPAKVLYVHLEPIGEDGKKKAVAIVDNDQLSLAIGKKGANSRIASRLTGWSIDIKELKDMGNTFTEGLDFKSVEELEMEEKAKAKKVSYDTYLAQIKAEAEKDTSIQFESGFEKEKPHQITDAELGIEPVKKAPKVEKFVEQPQVEETKPVETKVEEKPAEVKTTFVRTTTTLESLEADLEKQTKKETFKPTQKTSKRPRNITDDEQPNEEKVVTPKPAETAAPKLDIYSKEELEEMENEDFENENTEDFDEEIDYDEYDEYYDDDEK